MVDADFFNQQVSVKVRDQSRLEAVIETVDKDDLHLHVGCVDSPIFEQEHCAHLKWLDAGYKLDGLDIDTTGLEELRGYLKLGEGVLFDSVDEVAVANRHYDYLLIPDVIEHVGNVERFLFELDQLLTSRAFVISTPNALAAHAYVHQEVVYEEVHPDHNYWFSPYTLINVIRKYTSWEITEILLVERQQQIIVRGLTHGS